MAFNDFYFDLHIHPLIKSYYSGTPGKPAGNIWEELKHEAVNTPLAKLAEKNSLQVARHTQTNFEKLIKGKTRAVSVSLTPLERGFFEHRNLPKVVSSKKARREILSLISGMTYANIEAMDNHTDYYDELKQEYKYLVNGQGKNKAGEYYIANNYTELNNIVKNPEAIGIIMSIEGAHSLLDNEMVSGKLTQKELRKKLVQHVGEIKAWEHPPLFMTISHHFWNQLAGHARSIIGPTANIVTQQKGLDKGINGNGAVVMRELLSSDNGKRMLIDTKHFSLQARKEYYRFVTGFNRLSRTDKIPIIQSHASPNGFKTIAGSGRTKDSKKKLKDAYFHNLGINVSDEEFKIIHESGGLVGLILNKERLFGDKFSKSISGETDKKKIKDAYTKLIWDNLMRPVKELKTKEAWDIFCIGSDFDGAITHLDDYDGADKMPLLRDDLLEYLDHHKYEKQHWHGYKPEELVEKIMKTNGMDFMKKHFV